MNGRRIALAVLMGALIGFWCTGTAEAQLGGLKKKAQDAAKKEAEKKIDPAKPAEPAAPAETEKGENAQAGESSTASSEPGKGPWLNYDFVPGSQVIFFDDFAKDVVGNFPQRLEFVEGNMEVAEWKGERWLRASTDSRFAIPLPQVLPPKFTLEFDLYGAARGWSKLQIFGDDYALHEQAFVHFDITNVRAGLREGSKELAVAAVDENAFGNVIHGRVLGDGSYLKVYFNEKRVANVPKADFKRTNKLYFEISANEDRPLMLTNLRVAFSEKTMYDALAADGRVATQGIFFDSGSDKIRPESTPTLKEIGRMLTDHPELRILIEGHTDNVGDDASNQTLSEKRAASVAAYLTANHGVDAARLESKGFGETKPVSGNDTAEGRQNNRRVELVKL